MTVPRLGRVQLRIMQVLWERGRATAREITDALNEAEPIAHSTVQTLLRELEKKGAATHDREERTFVFRPLVASDEVKQDATRDFVERVFEGSPGGLVSHLLRNERISGKELSQIRTIIDNLPSTAGRGRKKGGK